MKKIIGYVDWTDFFAHLIEDYVPDDLNDDEKKSYNDEKRARLLNAVKEANEKGYEVDLHILSGGTLEYLYSSGWYDKALESLVEAGFPDLVKSLTTEYGADMVIDGKIIEKPFEQSKKLINGTLIEEISKTLPDSPNISYPTYKYFQNVRFEDPDMSEEQFNEYFDSVKGFKGSENFDLYDYYFPGYGVEIDVLPKGLNKGRGVFHIEEEFYENIPEEDIAFRIFNGDFYFSEFPMIAATNSTKILLSGSEDARYREDRSPQFGPLYTKETGPIPYVAGESKLDGFSMALESVVKSLPRLSKETGYKK